MFYVLLNYCAELKVSMCPKIGYYRQTELFKSSLFGFGFVNGNDWTIIGALDRRMVCNMYLRASAVLGRETT